MFVSRKLSECLVLESDGYSMAFGISDFAPKRGRLKNGNNIDQLIHDANKICDGARSVALSARPEAPSNKNMKGDILRCCKVYLPSHSDWCVGFEIELTGILSHYSRHRHGHVYEALGFSFATPLLIEVKFDPLGGGSSCFKSTGETQGKSLSRAFRGVLVVHGDMEFKISDTERNFVYDDSDLDEQVARVIDGSKANPMHRYGLRYLLYRMARDFFSAGGRDPDNEYNVLQACEENIFVRFLLFLGNRLASLLKRCFICNRKLPFTVSRLCSCGDESCLSRFESLGLGAQVLQQVIRMPLEVIDLEISFAIAAADSLRDVFEPFPPFLLKKRKVHQRLGRFINPRTNPINRSVRQNKSKDIGVMRSIIHSFPAVPQMKSCADEDELKMTLATSWLCTPEGEALQKAGKIYGGTEVWELPYKVLQFILNTNKLPLVLLSENDDKLLKVGKSQSHIYQFAVVQDSVEREAGNDISKSGEAGTIFAFHGSPAGNWYSILRNGLKCLSGTKLMSGGRSMGNGIYLANEYHTSAGYSRRSSTWNNGMYEDSVSVVSICEVFSSPILRDEPFPIFFVPREHEQSVAVRYLVVSTANENISGTAIIDRHILSHGSRVVNIAEHYRRIRQKYTADSSSEK